MAYFQDGKATLQVKWSDNVGSTAQTNLREKASLLKINFAKQLFQSKTLSKTLVLFFAKLPSLFPLSPPLNIV